MKNPETTIPFIVNWLKEYAENARMKGFVIGVSGGLDSALTSTLCAMTGMPTILVSMPIHQAEDQHSRSREHMNWLLAGDNKDVEVNVIHLSPAFDIFAERSFPDGAEDKLALVNTASRLRAVQLYQIANARCLLVAGTGNKVEDHGVGFFTKYGDGAVDLSPIADLTKTEARAFSRHLGILEGIVTATPTDGLWEDNRSDEEQIGASYEELEEAMAYHDSLPDMKDPRTPEEGAGDLDVNNADEVIKFVKDHTHLSERQVEVLEIYLARHFSTRHKLEVPPVCEIPNDLN